MTPGISEYGIISRVRNFVDNNSLYTASGFRLADDDKLLDFEVVDSNDISQMVAFIEGEFGVYVSNDEINEENLGSLRAVARFMFNKQPFAVG